MSEEDKVRTRAILKKVPVKDADGNIVVRPVSDSLVEQVFETAVLMALYLVTDEADLKAGIGSRVVQTVLTPKHALSLAEELITAANAILARRPDGPVN